MLKLFYLCIPSFFTVGLLPCKPGWEGFKDTCYMLISKKELWSRGDDITSKCAKLGGSALSINSKTENDFIKNKLKHTNVSNAWLGLTKGNAKWSDGTPVSFTNWEKQNSSFYSCTVTEYGKANGLWLMKSCKTHRPYFCRYRPQGK